MRSLRARRVVSLCSRARTVAGRLAPVLLALALLASAASTVAQEDAAESRATSFQAVEGPQKESVPGGPLLVGAYGFVLLMLLGYVARLGLLQRKTSAEVERLAQAIEQKRRG